MTTKPDIQAIQARLEKATPGSILTRYEHGGGRQMVEGTQRDGFTPGGPDRKLVADYYHEEDREFYFNALSDIPALLSYIGELEATIAALTSDQFDAVKAKQASIEREIAETKESIRRGARPKGLKRFSLTTEEAGE